MTAPAPTISDLADAYNEFITALGRLFKAIVEALLDPDTWSAIGELAGSIISMVFDGIGIGDCILGAIA